MVLVGDLSAGRGNEWSTECAWPHCRKDLLIFQVPPILLLRVCSVSVLAEEWGCEKDAFLDSCVVNYCIHKVVSYLSLVLVQKALFEAEIFGVLSH